MKVKYSTKNDKKFSKIIWSEIFKDEPTFTEFYFNFLHEPENLLIAFKGNKYIGSLYENPYPLLANKKNSTSKYIVAAAVLPEFRGEGVMKNLLATSIIENFYKKTSLFFLSPIDPNIYRRFGFEYVFDLEKYSFSSSELICFKKYDNIVKIDSENINDYKTHLKSIYDFMMHDFTNYLIRDDDYFSRHIQELQSENGYLFTTFREGEITGSISFFLENDTIKVRELFFKDRTSLSTIFFLLGSYVNYYSKIEIITPTNSYLNHYLPNEKKVIKTETSFLMGRIINLENTFNNYIEFKKFPNDITFSFKINDPILLENCGTWILKNGKVKKSEAVDYDIEIDIGALTQLIYGYFSLKEMIKLEKVRILCHDRIMPILKYFSKSKNYILEYV